MSLGRAGHYLSCSKTFYYHWKIISSPILFRFLLMPNSPNVRGTQESRMQRILIELPHVARWTGVLIYTAHHNQPITLQNRWTSIWIFNDTTSNVQTAIEMVL